MYLKPYSGTYLELTEPRFGEPMTLVPIFCIELPNESKHNIKLANQKCKNYLYKHLKKAIYKKKKKKSQSRSSS